MVKILAAEDKANGKIIAIVDSVIYKGELRAEEIDPFINALKAKDIAGKNTFGMLFSYINEIQHQQGKPYIKILFRGCTRRS